MIMKITSAKNEKYDENTFSHFEIQNEFWMIFNIEYFMGVKKNYDITV